LCFTSIAYANTEKAKAYRRTWYIKNRDKKLAQGRANYLRNREHILKKHAEWKDRNRDRHNAWNREYEKIYDRKSQCHKRYLRDKERLLAEGKAYRLAHPEQYKEYVRLYRRRHPELVRARSRAYFQTPKGREISKNSHHRRRTIYKDTDITTDWLVNLFKESRICKLCGKTMEDHGKYPNGKQLDHIKPLSRGGRHVMSNVRYICAMCNMTKSFLYDESKKESLNEGETRAAA